MYIDREIENRVSSKVDIVITVVGVVLSIWVGLNIYNVVEKNEFEKHKEEMSKAVSKTKKKIEKQLEDINVYNDSQIEKVEENIKELEKSKTNLDNKNKEMDYLIELHKLKVMLINGKTDCAELLRECFRALRKFNIHIKEGTYYSTYYDAFDIMETVNEAFVKSTSSYEKIINGVCDCSNKGIEECSGCEELKQGYIIDVYLILREIKEQILVIKELEEDFDVDLYTIIIKEIKEKMCGIEIEEQLLKNEICDIEYNIEVYKREREKKRGNKQRNLSGACHLSY